MIRIGSYKDNSKYNIYALHEDGSPRGNPVYKNVTLAEGERLVASLNEWQPRIADAS